MKDYIVQCRSMCTAYYHTSAESEDEAENNLDKFLERRGVGELEWETDWIDDIEIWEE